MAGDKQSRYDWIRRTLVKFDYLKCDKADKGTLIRYLEGERVFPGSTYRGMQCFLAAALLKLRGMPGIPSRRPPGERMGNGAITPLR